MSESNKGNKSKSSGKKVKQLPKHKNLVDQNKEFMMTLAFSEKEAKALTDMQVEYGCESLTDFIDLSLSMMKKISLLKKLGLSFKLFNGKVKKTVVNKSKTFKYVGELGDESDFLALVENEGEVIKVKTQNSMLGNEELVFQA